MPIAHHLQFRPRLNNKYHASEQFVINWSSTSSEKKLGWIRIQLFTWETRQCHQATMHSIMDIIISVINSAHFLLTLERNFIKYWTMVIKLSNHIYHVECSSRIPQFIFSKKKIPKLIAEAYNVNTFYTLILLISFFIVNALYLFIFFLEWYTHYTNDRNQWYNSSIPI